MSRQLSRIRSMVSEIEEIQKMGQSDGKDYLESTPPAHFQPTLISPPTDAPVAKSPVELKNARVSIQLTGQITVALQIENTDEIVEVRQIEDTIEIRFADGKAVHLPLKNVA